MGGPSVHELRRVLKADNLATNGVAHIINGVMIPPSSSLGQQADPDIVALAQSVPDLSTLVAGVVAADLVDTLKSPGPFTVFAPTNEGFDALPAGTLDSLLKPENKAQLADILTYHVLPSAIKSTDLKLFQAVETVEGKPLHVFKYGSKVFVGPSARELSKVTAADNLASNGVVHIIDGVMMPPAALGEQNSHTSKNILQVAEQQTDLSTLVAALVGADLADTLSGEGPFTLFAPTDTAFSALPAGTLDSLMKPENKATLVDILTYHVVPGDFPAAALGPFQAVNTVEGKPVHITKWGGSVRVGSSLALADLRNVIRADNIGTNGVFHVIDGVLSVPSHAVEV